MHKLECFETGQISPCRLRAWRRPSGDLAGSLRDPVPQHRTDCIADWRRSLFAIHDIEGLIALDVPWWTFDAICAVEDFLATRPHARVVEYGSGESTVWLPRRATSVMRVEHDADWHAMVQGWLETVPGLALVALTLVKPDAGKSDPAYGSERPGAAALNFRDYVQAIDAFPDNFDLIVIDGRAHEARLRHAMDRLTSSGTIVFDNSDRVRYRGPIDKGAFVPATAPGRTLPAQPFADRAIRIPTAGNNGGRGKD